MDGNIRYPMPKPPAGEPSRPRLTVETLDLEERIDACEKRIAKMVETKYDLQKSLRIHLAMSDDKSTDKRYNELYDYMDWVIAEDAKSLADLVKERKPARR